MSSFSSNGITVSLSDPEIWKKFSPDTEMIVTKHGRKLFPDIEVNISGLNPQTPYTILLYLKRKDKHKYTYCKSGSGWKEAEQGEEIGPVDKRQHKDGGRDGSHWMGTPVSFSNIRITNDPCFERKPKQMDIPILVHSLHKYQPMLVVKRCCDGYEEEFPLEMTEFMVVTMYQNNRILELKKSLNKFAAGFGPNGKHTEKKMEKETTRGRKRTASQTSFYPTPPPTASPAPSGTPPTPSWNPLTPISYPMLTPPSATPEVMTPDLTPPAVLYPYWNQYGMWNMTSFPQWDPMMMMSGGGESMQNFVHFGSSAQNFPTNLDTQTDLNNDAGQGGSGGVYNFSPF